MTTEKLQDKCRGSLIGGAIGDALGYEVEFKSLPEIRRRFGENGINRYVLHDGYAIFSDDTQMALFTAEGLLTAIAAGKLSEMDILPYMIEAYKNWYHTQSRSPMKMDVSWLTHIRRLWARRAPGMTCMSAMQSISMPESAPVVNNSKGCGGVMRVAPIGIFAAAHPDLLDIEHAASLAGYAAAITHKHPLSTYSSMALAMIVAECIAQEKVDRDSFRNIVRLFGLYCHNTGKDSSLAQLNNLLDKALSLAESDISDTDAIRGLGEGWVAEETLAIAVFSVMRYINDFEKCIVCSVNHDGDSDSTGAVAGNIIGALLGYNAIPEKFKTDLELLTPLLSVADNLSGTSSAVQMAHRYGNHQPYGISEEYLL